MTLAAASIALVAALAACRAPRAVPDETPEVDTLAEEVDGHREAPLPLGAAERAGDAMPVRLRAMGNEPFWNVDVDSLGLVYIRLGSPDTLRLVADRVTTPAKATYTGTSGEASVVLDVRRAACADTMADTTYAFTATLHVGSETLRGCATPR